MESKGILNKKKHMEEMVNLLNRARRTYEQEDREIMSNFEYDKLYDELLDLEKELGITMAQSPTVNVGYEVLVQSCRRSGMKVPCFRWIRRRNVPD